MDGETTTTTEVAAQTQQTATVEMQAAAAAAEAARLLEEAKAARAAADALALNKAAADKAAADDLKSQLAELEKIKKQLADEAKRRADDARWAHLQALGVQHVTREQALMLAPAVDATTAEGRAALDAFRDAHAALFSGRVDPVAEVEQRVAQVPTFNGSRLYPLSWQQDLIRRFANGGMK